MPTYSTFETIQEVMQDRNCISWRVIDEDENQLHNYSPKPTTLWRDSFNTLKKFIEGIDGTNYVIIRVYAPEYKKGAGGDTSTTIFTYYYRLKGAKSTQREETQDTGMNGGYMQLVQQMNAMRMEFLEKEHKAEIKRLEDKLKESKSEDKNYFEKVAQVIGKELGKEWLRAEGYAVDEEGVPTGERISGTKKEPVKEKEPAPEEKQKVGDVFKRTGDATVRIMKVSKLLGSDYDAVAESFEDIATLAETNPLKLKEIFDKLKE